MTERLNTDTHAGTLLREGNWHHMEVGRQERSRSVLFLQVSYDFESYCVPLPFIPGIIWPWV